MGNRVKNRGTVLSFGSGNGAADLAAAVALAGVSFGCTITTMNGLEKSRSTTTDEDVFCDDAFTPQDTDKLSLSSFTIEGYVDDSAEYVAAATLAETMLDADTQGTFVITEPNTTDKLWFEHKFIKFSKLRGSPNDKQMFSIELIARTMPADA